VRRGQGSIDTADQNRFALAAFYDAVVGSANQVSTGAAAFTSIGAALTYAGPNGTVLVLRGSYTENVQITGQQAIWGQGRGTVINGNLEYTSTAAYAVVKTLKVTGNISFDAGSVGNMLTECWQPHTSTFTDNGTDNVFNPVVLE
jgi:hypothetical protein